MTEQATIVTDVNNLLTSSLLRLAFLATVVLTLALPSTFTVAGCSSSDAANGETSVFEGDSKYGSSPEEAQRLLNDMRTADRKRTETIAWHFTTDRTVDSTTAFGQRTITHETSEGDSAPPDRSRKTYQRTYSYPDDPSYDMTTRREQIVIGLTSYDRTVDVEGDWKITEEGGSWKSTQLSEKPNLKNTLYSDDQLVSSLISHYRIVGDGNTEAEKGQYHLQLEMDGEKLTEQIRSFSPEVVSPSDVITSFTLDYWVSKEDLALSKMTTTVHFTQGPNSVPGNISETTECSNWGESVNIEAPCQNC